MRRVKFLLDASLQRAMLHPVMQFPTSNVALLSDGENTIGRAFGSPSNGLIIGVLVLGLIPGCGPP